MNQPAQDPIATAQQLIGAGREAAALDILRNLVGANAALGDRWLTVMQLCERLGDEDASAEAARQFGALAPADTQRALIYADKLARIGQSAAALKITAQLTTTSPNDPAAAYMHGIFLARAGDFPEAGTAFRICLKLKPDLADAWVQLGAIGSFGETPGDLDAMRALAKAGPDSAKPAILYALGKAYDDFGETEKAVTAWKSANEWLAKTRPFNRRELAHTASAAKVFAPDISEPASGYAGGGPTPIFIVGAPRTGTTLTEQILSAHPDVYALGESLISRVATWPVRHLAPQHIDAAKQKFGDQLWPMMGGAYSALANRRANSERFVTDKAAMLHLFVGVLAKALPSARFVWVNRTPQAAAMSAFRTYFTQGSAWSCQIEDALTYLQAHNALMRDWAGMLGDRMLELRYETLASAPDSEIPRLTAFAGLRPNPAPQNFHLSTRPVETASFAQVRRPMGTASIESWRKYTPYLPALATDQP